MDRYLITGASRGIGRAIAIRLARPDRTLLLHGRDKEALDESCRKVSEKGARAVAVAADISSVEGVEKLADRAGSDKLDVLVNNAGVAFVEPFEKITLEHWQKTLAVNITAPFVLIQRLLDRLPRGASIVNILSVAARTVFPNWSSYCMSKFALEGLSRCLREELRPRGIRVINIYPAATASGMWDNIEGNWKRDKMLPPAEVAEAVAYALERPASVLVEDINLGNVTGNQ
ncbi:MAG: SDR family oxidoreductase [candidate division Zixibacteria bacterium]|nr:SDR family oxidoreductase [candidate division Zixibacteria bacterium]